MLFAVSGYEAENGAAKEMRNPQRDVPVSVAVSGSISTLAYLIPILAMIVVLPIKQDHRARPWAACSALRKALTGPRRPRRPSVGRRPR